MKFLLLLMVATFLQTSFLPINLTLILLLVRLLILEERSNLNVSFFAGLILGLLSLTNLAFYPILFVLISKLVSLFKSSPLFSNIFTNILLGILLLLASGWLEKSILHQELTNIIMISEVITFIPLYLGGRFLVENFYVKRPLKLRM